MSRALVIDTASGAILRTITASPTMLAEQVLPGEAVFVITDDTGAFINDAALRVSEAGEIEALTGSAPVLSIELVA